jgi:hypothetical protein
MGQATHEQVNLLLRLYELRREPRLRQARSWFTQQFNASSPEEMMKKYPPASEESLNIRMTVSYWDMVASIVNRGLIDDELVFENTGEFWVVWERIKPLVPAWRAAFKNPYLFASLEELYKRLEAWQEKRAPGSTAAMRQMMEQMRATAKAAAE